MTRYRVWIRLNQTQTTFVEMTASYATDIPLMVEAQYGPGSYISCSEIS